MLRALLIGPLRFTPVTEERRRGYSFEGRIALDRLLSGVVDLCSSSGQGGEMPPLVASPARSAQLGATNETRNGIARVVSCLLPRAA